MSDHPDWTDSSVIASQSQEIFATAVPAALPFIESSIDVSLFASVDITVTTSGAVGDNPSLVALTWFIAGRAIYNDEFTMWNSQSSDGPSGLTFSSPCRGDSLTIEMQGPVGATTVVMSVVGSSRAVSSPILNGYPGVSPGIMYGVTGLTIPVNTIHKVRLGPTIGKMDILYLATTQTVAAFTTGWFNNKSGAFQKVTYNQGNVTTTQALFTTNVAMVNAAIELDIQNGNAGVANVNVSVFGHS